MIPRLSISAPLPHLLQKPDHKGAKQDATEQAEPAGHILIPAILNGEPENSCPLPAGPAAALPEAQPLSITRHAAITGFHTIAAALLLPQLLEGAPFPPGAGVPGQD